MSQRARTVSAFGRRVDHFEQNAAVHTRADAAIEFDSTCEIPDAVRGPLIESMRRFQLGESGDGDL
jgi:hypothetical protein